MDRVTKMSLRVFIPALGAALGSIPLAWVSWRLADSNLLAGLANSWRYAAFATLIASLCLVGYASFRLWRWSTGQARTCTNCDCLVGRERLGRYGAYRRCLGCGKNAPVAS